MDDCRRMTVAEKTPSEIARDTLKLLMTRKLAPNPANFRTVYHEVSGTPEVQPFPGDPLRHIVQALPLRTPAQQKQRAHLDNAIAQQNWGELQSALVAYANAAATSPAAAVTARAEPSNREFLEQLARLIENALPALGSEDERFAEQAAHLIAAIRDPASSAASIKSLLGNFTMRLSFAAEDQAEIRTTLLKLLQLIFQNIGELSRDDPWMKKQIDALMDAAAPPLSLRRLDDVGRRMKELMFKQAMARDRALEAQEEMRRMLATFVERLSQMTESTSAHSAMMEASARQIEQAKSFEDIGPVMKEVVSATRSIAYQIKNTHEELRAMREKVTATEAEIAKLRQELDTASSQARHDALTGALNRKGLDEALVREIAEVKRKDTPLCTALLDIDNFKKLNDARGHDTGDAALTHLVAVTRESMRPQDTLARYGGEEFVIVMPDTRIEQGMEAMTRLQRALTKRFFLADNEKIVITFSAGVAQLASGETAQDAIRRADQAMYLAKRAGKNRVVGA
jgi:diguanylate cyclase